MCPVVRILEFWLLKHIDTHRERSIIRICFVFVLIPATGIWGCFPAADYDLPPALAEAWFCQLHIVSAIACCLEFWDLFRE